MTENYFGNIIFFFPSSKHNYNTILRKKKKKTLGINSKYFERNLHLQCLSDKTFLLANST